MVAMHKIIITPNGGTVATFDVAAGSTVDELKEALFVFNGTRPSGQRLVYGAQYLDNIDNIMGPSWAQVCVAHILRGAPRLANMLEEPP